MQGERRRRLPLRAAVLCFAFCILRSTFAFAGDPEGCLTCHQYRGLTRIDESGKTVDLFYVNPNYYNMALGPHSRLKCTDCHKEEDVNVFPHKLPPAPVDCTKTCHLENGGQIERRFSHDKLDHTLQGSVHTRQVLDKTNKLLDSPLRDGQAQCLFCHDEPTFRGAGKSWVETQAPVDRCNSCHDEQLPKDTTYAFWHVHARSQPARNNQDLARVCATCHSNAKVRAEFKLPDATASYLVSFHGKAAMLGSTTTAGCLDCHVGQIQNVHHIQAHADPTSPTSAQNLPNTCRTPACHRAAGPQISTAAVHLNLATTRGVEFFIACIFVVLILFTFGPSLLITALKMVQIIIGREEPETHDNAHRAEQLMKDPVARQKLLRFNVHQRLQHWYLVICFATLVLTGFPIKMADQPWAAWLIRVFGGIPQARLLHRIAGTALIIGFFYHLIYVVRTIRRNRKRNRTGLIKTVLTLPMMVSIQDALMMQGIMFYLLGIKKKHPVAGRFNAEEKFEYIGVFWGTFVLGTTGLLMWFNAWTTQHLPGRILTIATLLHTFEAFLALLHVGICHMANVIFAPGVFPMSKAMFTGETPLHELAHGHAGMIAEVAKEHGTVAVGGGDV